MSEMLLLVYTEAESGSMLASELAAAICEEGNDVSIDTLLKLEESNEQLFLVNHGGEKHNVRGVLPSGFGTMSDSPFETVDERENETVLNGIAQRNRIHVDNAATGPPKTSSSQSTCYSSAINARALRRLPQKLDNFIVWQLRPDWKRESNDSYKLARPVSSSPTDASHWSASQDSEVAWICTDHHQ